MEEDARLLGIQTDRLLICDEMHFMAACSQFNAKFRADHTAAAVRGVTGYPYFHFFASLQTIGLFAVEMPFARDSLLGSYARLIAGNAFVSAWSLIRPGGSRFTK
jgi:hypothetical protein